MNIGTIAIAASLQLLASLTNAVPTAPEQSQVAANPSAPRPQKMIAVGEIKPGAAQELNAPLQVNLLANLRKSLVSNLAKTRKFAILDREFADELRAEKNPEGTDRSEAGRTAKLGQEATADFILTGSIKNCETRSTVRPSSASGKSVSDYSYKLQVEIRLVDVVSGRILFADSIAVAKSGSVMSKAPEVDSWLMSSCEEVASKGVAKILEYIYPLQVIVVNEDGTVIINEGEGRVLPKQRFEAYRLGKKLIDPYTNVELGFEEILEGEIEITRVLPKSAYGKIENAPGKITQGAILRRFTAASNPSEVKKAASPIVKNDDL